MVDSLPGTSDRRPAPNSIAGLGSRKLIIGVDRLDYSKGIPQRMEAYERFLVNNPDQRGHVTYLQIAPTSRSEVPEYDTLSRVVNETLGRINGSLGEPGWVPIQYVTSTYPRSLLAPLYRLARVALVTPMRDGMNLVAKEYVAAQDPLDPGVLILSKFAGAAQQLTGALIVNPNDKLEKPSPCTRLAALEEREWPRTKEAGSDQKPLPNYRIPKRGERARAGRRQAAITISSPTSLAASRTAQVIRIRGGWTCWQKPHGFEPPHVAESKSGATWLRPIMRRDRLRTRRRTIVAPFWPINSRRLRAPTSCPAASQRAREHAVCAIAPRRDAPEA
jgi:Glycosyltransferase family 20